MNLWMHVYSLRVTNMALDPIDIGQNYIKIGLGFSLYPIQVIGIMKDPFPNAFNDSIKLEPSVQSTTDPHRFHFDHLYCRRRWKVLQILRNMVARLKWLEFSNHQSTTRFSTWATTVALWRGSAQPSVSWSASGWTPSREPVHVFCLGCWPASDLSHTFPNLLCQA